jgi:hypothetical protein
MAFGVIFHRLLASSAQENFVDEPLPSFNAFYVQRSGLVSHVSYGYHAINLMVSNEALQQLVPKAKIFEQTIKSLWQTMHCMI